jgi:hypothetical protein
LEGEHSTTYEEVDIYAMTSHYRSRQRRWINWPLQHVVHFPFLYVLFISYKTIYIIVIMSLFLFSLMSLFSLFPVVF